jgi:hypothetical protein
LPRWPAIWGTGRSSPAASCEPAAQPGGALWLVLRAQSLAVGGEGVNLRIGEYGCGALQVLLGVVDNHRQQLLGMHLQSLSFALRPPNAQLAGACGTIDGSEGCGSSPTKRAPRSAPPLPGQGLNILRSGSSAVRTMAQVSCSSSLASAGIRNVAMRAEDKWPSS